MMPTTWTAARAVSALSTPSSPVLFVYGTLMSPMILSTLLGRQPVMISDALLYDFGRFPVKEETYPGIVHRPGASVRGIVLPDLTTNEFQILDEYEGQEYKRTEVEVGILATTDVTNLLHESEPQQQQRRQMVSAVTYVWNNPDTELDIEHGDWDFDSFCRLHLKQFLVRIAKP